MPSKRVIFVLLFIFAEVFTFAVFRYWAVSRNIDKTGENPKQSAQNANPPADGSKILIEKVGRLILLPQNELPSIAAINNAVQLQKDSLFYKDARNGDMLLIYFQAKKAYIYNPEKNIIINTGPLILEKISTDIPAAPTSTASST